jgi:hypothetical protein
MSQLQNEKEKVFPASKQNFSRTRYLHLFTAASGKVIEMSDRI